MGKLLDLLGAPLTGFVEKVGEVIDKLHTSGDEKLQAQKEVLALRASLQLELARIDTEWAKTQAEVIREETRAGGLARAWRPILMLTFTAIIAWNFIFAPIFSLPFAEIPQDMWELLKIGVGGYVLARSGEKMVQTYTKTK